jgi:hypothetical protein
MAELFPFSQKALVEGGGDFQEIISRGRLFFLFRNGGLIIIPATVFTVSSFG